jgi:pimeloyl-ACP methyl ester carboxylesterase
LRARLEAASESAIDPRRAFRAARRSFSCSCARIYWESQRATAAAAASGQTPPEVSLPVAITVFPGEIFRAPRSWAERVYPNLVYFNEVDRGGHFAAWEEPDLFAEEMRAAFKSLR